LTARLPGAPQQESTWLGDCLSGAPLCLDFFLVVVQEQKRQDD
jgi:hypothetical protein